MPPNVVAHGAVIDRLRLADASDPAALARAAGRWLAGSGGVQLAVVVLALVTVGAIWWELRQRRAVRAEERETGTGWFWDGLSEATDGHRAEPAERPAEVGTTATGRDIGVGAARTSRHPRTPALTG